METRKSDAMTHQLMEEEDKRNSGSVGREILVGGKSNTWKVPDSTEETLNHWSERTRFKIGDSLLWKYNAENDSVMQWRRWALPKREKLLVVVLSPNHNRSNAADAPLTAPVTKAREVIMF
ncbi:hypothetical protein Bca52824_004467 [Brassica carinata]|uniref:Phytocyanin domain-containing protein n=1 Tax=Brassica carinata TaxID=52824 RepID=A0A8X7WPS4_BRACI|nr:hypothetical protein Bca52824_004467 [Brassica carinata]